MVARRVQSAMTISFKDFAPFDSAQGRPAEKWKVEIIVSFLALLELVKPGAVAAEQYGEHGDIRISHTASASVPHYG